MSYGTTSFSSLKAWGLRIAKLSGFKKARVDRHEIIEALEAIIKELRAHK